MRCPTAIRCISASPAIAARPKRRRRSIAPTSSCAWVAYQPVIRPTGQRHRRPVDADHPGRHRRRGDRPQLSGRGRHRRRRESRGGAVPRSARRGRETPPSRTAWRGEIAALRERQARLTRRRSRGRSDDAAARVSRAAQGAAARLHGHARRRGLPRARLRPPELRVAAHALQLLRSRRARDGHVRRLGHSSSDGPTAPL